MTNLTKNEKRVLGLLQSYKTLEGVSIKKKVFNNKKGRTKQTMQKLQEKGMIQRVGLTRFAWTNRFPEPFVVEKRLKK